MTTNDFESQKNWLKQRFHKVLIPSPIYQCKGPSVEGIKKEAAVLILLDKREDDWYVFLTQRSFNMRSHAGEVSFPGGQREPADLSSVDTALREANEETGVPFDFMDVIGPIRHLITRLGVQVHPVIALQKQSFQPLPNEEVEECFWAPLRLFLSIEHYKLFVFKSIQLRSHFFEYQGQTIFGITSYMCILVAMSIHNAYPQFEVGRMTNKSQLVDQSILEELSDNDKIPPQLNRDEYNDHVIRKSKM